MDEVPEQYIPSVPNNKRVSDQLNEKFFYHDEMYL